MLVSSVSPVKTAHARLIEYEEIMSLLRWMAIATLAISPMAVIAQDKTKQPDPANPAAASAPASAPAHQSAFSGYHAFSESKESPAAVWRAANDEMGRVGGHMG